MKRRQFCVWMSIGTAASTLAACDRQSETPSAPVELPSSSPDFDRSVRADGFQAIGTVEQLERDGEVADRTAKAIAIRQPDSGELIAFSSQCTHQACGVDWNPDESVFTCPCHGSRFSPQGAVSQGPAVLDLTSYDVKIDGDLVLVKIAA